MSLFVLLLTLALVGVVTWALVTYIPMPQGIKTVIVIVAVVACVAYALQAFGVLGRIHGPAVPTVATK